MGKKWELGWPSEGKMKLKALKEDTIAWFKSLKTVSHKNEEDLDSAFREVPSKLKSFKEKGWLHSHKHPSEKQVMPRAYKKDPSLIADSDCSKEEGGNLSSPSKSRRGFMSARQYSRSLLDEEAGSDNRPKSAGSETIEWGRDIPSEKLAYGRDVQADQKDSKGESPYTSRELPTGAGLDLGSLIKSRPEDDKSEDESRAKGFSWGTDLADSRPSAKTKAAKLFGKAGSMLKEAGSSVSSVTSAVALQAQAATAKARGAQAERRGSAVRSGGDVVPKRKLGSLLARPKKSNSPGSLGRLSSDTERASASVTTEGAVGLSKTSPKRIGREDSPKASGRESMDVPKVSEVLKRVQLSSSALSIENPPQQPPELSVVGQSEALLIDLGEAWEQPPPHSGPSTFSQPGIPMQPSQGAGYGASEDTAVTSPQPLGNPFAQFVQQDIPHGISAESVSPFPGKEQPGDSEAKNKEGKKGDDDIMDHLLDL